MGGREEQNTHRGQAKSDPVAAFCAFLEETWSDNDEATAYAIWKLKVSQATSYAPDALACLDAIIANPPEGLAAIMRKCGWIDLKHPSQDENSPATPYTDREYLDWLKETTGRLKAIYADNRPPDEPRRVF